MVIEFVDHLDFYFELSDADFNRLRGKFSLTEDDDEEEIFSEMIDRGWSRFTENQGGFWSP